MHFTTRLRAFHPLLPIALLLAGFCAPAAHAVLVIDLADVTTSEGVLRRVHGSAGDGSRGVPVAGGLDADDDVDHFPDYAMAAMLASPLGVSGAGEIYLVFGDGTLNGVIDTAVTQSGVLKIAGAGVSEAAGSEIWMDDVTGDGIGDLLIARQNFSFMGRTGAGALSILVGGSELRTHAATLTHLELASPPAGVTLATFVGAVALDRLGIWMRTGDITNDGIADIVVGADQADGAGNHSGEVYVIRGGAHLAATQTIDLANFGSTPLAGHLAKVTPPAASAEFHFGATCQIADLDGNSRAEVLVGATIFRAGGSILADGAAPGSAHASAGETDGTLFIAWDDNFTDPWAAGLTFSMDATPGSATRINGASCNVNFGEEILGGLDYDRDAAADLFVGDITGNCGPTSRPNAGSGHVFYDAAALKGLDLDLQSPHALAMTEFYGAATGDIGADTALHGDFDRDGADDLAFSSPHRDPFGRKSAGAIHVFFGQFGGWPDEIDIAALPPEHVVRITEIDGAKGEMGSDAGDTLSYSAAAGDLNGDGYVDIITNEMLGNGVLPAAEDSGNLILLSGAFVAAPRVPVLPPLGVGLLAALLAAAALRARQR